MTTFAQHITKGIHSARPAANAVPAGGLYACSTHGKIYQTDGVSTWSDWYVGAAGAKVLQLKVLDDATVLTVGDGKLIVVADASLGGLNLTGVAAFVTTVSSSGLPTVQIRNVTQAVDMLTTKVSIDASEFTSYSAATPPVIDSGNADVATGDLIAVDVDVAGTGAKGLGVVLTFS
jgi:hypothetical protein